jgi:DNA-3-methyladenine glycosylase
MRSIRFSSAKASRPRPRATRGGRVGGRVSARLGRRFYARATLEVAEALLGRTLVHEMSDGVVGGRIVEVEAYVGPDDPASHAVAGRTRRKRLHVGRGRARVRVLHVRHALLPQRGHRGRRFSGRPFSSAPSSPPWAWISCAAAGPIFPTGSCSRDRAACAPASVLSRADDGIDLVTGRLWIGRSRRLTGPVSRSTRVGIRKGLEQPWRLFEAGRSQRLRSPSGQRDETHARAGEGARPCDCDPG